MRILFLHPSATGQLAVAAHTLAARGHDIVYVSNTDTRGQRYPYRTLDYGVEGRPPVKTFEAPQSLQGNIELAGGAFLACQHHLAGQWTPDLIVGHSFFGSYLFLRALWPTTRVVGYFEHYAGRYWTDDLAIRPDYPPNLVQRVNQAAYEGMLQLQANAADALWAPLPWQAKTARQFSADWFRKTFVEHEGIDTDFWCPDSAQSRALTIAGVSVAANDLVLSYCARGLESIRGFDLLIQMVAKLFRNQTLDADYLRQHLHVLVAGRDRVCYGHDLAHIPAEHEGSFVRWTMARYGQDIPAERFHLLGGIPATELRSLFRRSDLHVYLTAPWPLSWSCLQAMSCGVNLLASATPPVLDVCTDRNATLVDLEQPSQLAALARHGLIQHLLPRVLTQRQAARSTVVERFDCQQVTPKIETFFEDVCHGRFPRPVA